jgi:hypothetical protein
MLKNILKLDGAESLSNKEQMKIVGGRTPHKSTCIYPVEVCLDGSIYDPCEPLAPHNPMC